MTQEKKVQTAAVMDVTGVERSAQDAVRAARTMAEGITREGEKAGKGLEGMGAGAEKAERTIEAKTKSISDRIRRLTQQSQRDLAGLAAGSAGGAGSAAAVEFEASLRGADVSKLQPQIAALRELQTQTNALNASMQRATAGSAFLASLQQQAGAIGKTRAELAELKAAELGVATQAAPLIAALKAADGSLASTGMSAKATAAALRTVPAQVTDIFTSLQAGQSPLTVLLQQGGQLKDQFGGIGPAAGALGGYLAGLVNPFTVAAAAAGVLVVSLAKADTAVSATTRALLESGNQAGQTTADLLAMADAIDAVGGGTSSRALDLLTQLAKTGDVGAAGLQRYAAAALAFEKAGGQAADKTVEAFNELGRAPVQASLKLNEATNFLTASTYAQIKSLEDQGRTLEAARVASDAYADALEGRTPAMLASLSALERAWKFVKEESKQALDEYLRIFRTETTGEQLGRVRKEIELLQKAGQKGYVFGASVNDLLSQERNLQELVRLDQKTAERDRSRKLRTDAERDVSKLEADTLSKELRMRQELDRFNRAADTAGTDPKRRAGIEAAIRAKYADKAGGSDRGLARAQLGADLQDIRSIEAERAAIYRQSEAIIQAQRRAGLLSEAEYYEARRGFIALDEASRTSALQAEINRLQQFKGTAAEEAQARRDLTAATGKLNQARTEAAGRAALLAIEEQSLIDVAQAELQIQRTRADAEIYRIREGSRDYKTAAGMGDRRRTEFLEEINLQAEFTRRKAALEEDYVRGKFAGREEAYRAELTLLITEEGKQLAALQEAQRRKREVDADARAGFSRGLDNVIEGTADLGARTARLTEDAFGQLGNALTDVFTKGKADWRGLEQTIVSGITRIIVEQQLIKPLAQFLQGGSGGGAGGSFLDNLVGGALSFVFGGGGGSGMPDSVPTRGGRAAGGPVERGGLYEINETGRGPGEILNSGGRQYLMALQGGYVQPASAEGAGAGGRTLNQTNHFHVTGAMDRRTQQQVAMQAGRAAQQSMARNG